MPDKHLEQHLRTDPRDQTFSNLSLNADLRESINLRTLTYSETTPLYDVLKTEDGGQAHGAKSLSDMSRSAVNLTNTVFTMDVAEIKDGDTLSARGRLIQKPISIRLGLIDTPEVRHWGKAEFFDPSRADPGQPLGQEARQYLAKLLPPGSKARFITGSENVVDVHGSRAVGLLVNQKGQLVNLEMVRAGFARFAYPEGFGTKLLQKFAKAEAEAKQAGRGIWSLDHMALESPAAHRKSKGTANSYFAAMFGLKPTELVLPAPPGKAASYDNRTLFTEDFRRMTDPYSADLKRYIVQPVHNAASRRAVFDALVPNSQTMKPDAAEKIYRKKVQENKHLYGVYSRYWEMLYMRAKGVDPGKVSVKPPDWVSKADEANLQRPMGERWAEHTGWIGLYNKVLGVVGLGLEPNRVRQREGRSLFSSMLLDSLETFYTEQQASVSLYHYEHTPGYKGQKNKSGDARPTKLEKGLDFFSNLAGLNFLYATAMRPVAHFSGMVQTGMMKTLAEPMPNSSKRGMMRTVGNIGNKLRQLLFGIMAGTSIAMWEDAQSLANPAQAKLIAEGQKTMRGQNTVVKAIEGLKRITISARTNMPAWMRRLTNLTMLGNLEYGHLLGVFKSLGKDGAKAAYGNLMTHMGRGAALWHLGSSAMTTLSVYTSLSSQAAAATTMTLEEQLQIANRFDDYLNKEIYKVNGKEVEGLNQIWRNRPVFALKAGYNNSLESLKTGEAIGIGALAGGVAAGLIAKGGIGGVLAMSTFGALGAAAAASTLSPSTMTALVYTTAGAIGGAAAANRGYYLMGARWLSKAAAGSSTGAGAAVAASAVVGGAIGFAEATFPEFWRSQTGVDRAGWNMTGMVHFAVDQYFRAPLANAYRSGTFDYLSGRMYRFTGAAIGGAAMAAAVNSIPVVFEGGKTYRGWGPGARATVASVLFALPMLGTYAPAWFGESGRKYSMDVNHIMALMAGVPYQPYHPGHAVAMGGSFRQMIMGSALVHQTIRDFQAGKATLEDVQMAQMRMQLASASKNGKSPTYVNSYVTQVGTAMTGVAYLGVRESIGQNLSLDYQTIYGYQGPFQLGVGISFVSPWSIHVDPGSDEYTVRYQPGTAAENLARVATDPLFATGGLALSVADLLYINTPANGFARFALGLNRFAMSNPMFNPFGLATRFFESATATGMIGAQAAANPTGGVPNSYVRPAFRALRRALNVQSAAALAFLAAERVSLSNYGVPGEGRYLEHAIQQNKVIRENADAAMYGAALVTGGIAGARLGYTAGQPQNRQVALGLLGLVFGAGISNLIGTYMADNHIYSNVWSAMHLMSTSPAYGFLAETSGPIPVGKVKHSRETNPIKGMINILGLALDAESTRQQLLDMASKNVKQQGLALLTTTHLAVVQLFKAMFDSVYAGSTNVFMGISSFGARLETDEEWGTYIKNVYMQAVPGFGDYTISGGTAGSETDREMGDAADWNMRFQLASRSEATPSWKRRVSGSMFYSHGALSAATPGVRMVVQNRMMMHAWAMNAWAPDMAHLFDLEGQSSSAFVRHTYKMRASTRAQLGSEKSTLFYLGPVAGSLRSWYNRLRGGADMLPELDTGDAALQERISQEQMDGGMIRLGGILAANSNKEAIFGKGFVASVLMMLGTAMFGSSAGAYIYRRWREDRHRYHTTYRGNILLGMGKPLTSAGAEGNWALFELNTYKSKDAKYLIQYKGGTLYGMLGENNKPLGLAFNTQAEANLKIAGLRLLEEAAIEEAADPHGLLQNLRNLIGRLDKLEPAHAPGIGEVLTSLRAVDDRINADIKANDTGQVKTRLNEAENILKDARKNAARIMGLSHVTGEGADRNRGIKGRGLTALWHKLRLRLASIRRGSSFAGDADPTAAAANNNSVRSSFFRTVQGGPEEGVSLASHAASSTSGSAGMNQQDLTSTLDAEAEKMTKAERQANRGFDLRNIGKWAARAAFAANALLQSLFLLTTISTVSALMDPSNPLAGQQKRKATLIFVQGVYIPAVISGLRFGVQAFVNSKTVQRLGARAADAIGRAAAWRPQWYINTRNWFFQPQANLHGMSRVGSFFATRTPNWVVRSTMTTVFLGNTVTGGVQNLARGIQNRIGSLMKPFSDLVSKAMYGNNWRAGFHRALGENVFGNGAMSGINFDAIEGITAEELAMLAADNEMREAMGYMVHHRARASVARNNLSQLWHNLQERYWRGRRNYLAGHDAAMLEASELLVGRSTAVLLETSLATSGQLVAKPVPGASGAAAASGQTLSNSVVGRALTAPLNPQAAPANSGHSVSGKTARKYSRRFPDVLAADRVSRAVMGPGSLALIGTGINLAIPIILGKVYEHSPSWFRNPIEEKHEQLWNWSIRQRSDKTFWGGVRGGMFPGFELGMAVSGAAGAVSMMTAAAGTAVLGFLPLLEIGAGVMAATMLYSGLTAKYAPIQGGENKYLRGVTLGAQMFVEGYAKEAQMANFNYKAQYDAIFDKQKLAKIRQAHQRQHSNATHGMTIAGGIIGLGAGLLTVGLPTGTLATAAGYALGSLAIGAIGAGVGLALAAIGVSFHDMYLRNSYARRDGVPYARAQRFGLTTAGHWVDQQVGGLVDVFGAVTNIANPLQAAQNQHDLIHGGSSPSLTNPLLKYSPIFHGRFTDNLAQMREAQERARMGPIGMSIYAMINAQTLGEFSTGTRASEQIIDADIPAAFYGRPEGLSMAAAVSPRIGEEFRPTSPFEGTEALHLAVTRRAELTDSWLYGQLGNRLRQDIRFSTPNGPTPSGKEPQSKFSELKYIMTMFGVGAGLTVLGLLSPVAAIPATVMVGLGITSMIGSIAWSMSYTWRNRQKNKTGKVSKALNPNSFAHSKRMMKDGSYQVAFAGTDPLPNIGMMDARRLERERTFELSAPMFDKNSLRNDLIGSVMTGIKSWWESFTNSLWSSKYSVTDWKAGGSTYASGSYNNVNVSSAPPSYTEWGKGTTLLKGAYISTPFDPEGKRGRRHMGQDEAVDAGTPIPAARKGKVVFAGVFGAFGNFVVIQHGKSFMTGYGHASQILVNVGDEVDQGRVIALVGSTGRSTGPHLHLEVRHSEKGLAPSVYGFLAGKPVPKGMLEKAIPSAVPANPATKITKPTPIAMHGPEYDRIQAHNQLVIGVGVNRFVTRFGDYLQSMQNAHNQQLPAHHPEAQRKPVHVFESRSGWYEVADMEAGLSAAYRNKKISRADYESARRMLPDAIAAERAGGPPAAMTIGQAFHETMYEGRPFNSPLARINNNYFGLRGNGRFGIQGHSEPGNWAAFTHWRESLKEYAHRFTRKDEKGRLNIWPEYAAGMSEWWHHRDPVTAMKHIAEKYAPTKGVPAAEAAMNKNYSGLVKNWMVRLGLITQNKKDPHGVVGINHDSAFQGQPFVGPPLPPPKDAPPASGADSSATAEPVPGAKITVVVEAPHRETHREAAYDTVKRKSEDRVPGIRYGVMMGSVVYTATGFVVNHEEAWSANASDTTVYVDPYKLAMDTSMRTVM